MNKYHVTYWYLATGQEGIPYEEDFGIIEADTDIEAKFKAIKHKLPRLKKENPTSMDGTIISIAMDGLQAKLV